jgi:hypothetical protein
MVKIDFLTATPLDKSSIAKTGETTPKFDQQKETPEIADDKETIAEIEEITQPITPSIKKERAKISDEEESQKAPPKTFKIESKEEQPIFETVDEDIEYYPSKSKRKIFLIPLILVIIIATGFGVYQIIKKFPISSLFKSEKTTQKKTAPTTEAQGVSTIPQPLLETYQNNLGINLFIQDKLQKIISLRSNTTRFSLIVITPGEINLTVVSDSEAKIGQFRNNLANLLNELNFRILSTKSRIVSNRKLYFADLSCKIDPATITPYSDDLTKLKQVTDIPAEMSNLTKVHKLKLDYLKNGRTLDGNLLQEHFHYMGVSGNREGMINFLNELTSSYPLLRINKISANPSNFVTYSDSYINLRFNISYYQPK